MTNAERQARFRDRQRAAGLVRVDVWVPAECVEQIRSSADAMASWSADVRRQVEPQTEQE